MYTITVDDKDLYVPDLEDYQVSSATISINTDSVAYLDMDIPCTNKGLKEIKQQASIVRVYDNDVLRYKMFVDNIDYDFDNTAKVSCTSVLAYLKDSLVRPYSTVDSEEGLTAPSSVNGYFSWLIEQHNKNIRDTKKYFYVGVNQGAVLDRNNYIYRSSTEVPTTSDEIKNKILDTYGAYISLTFNGDLNVINLYADVHDSNDQVIDFGVNLLDLTRSVSTESSYTAVRPTGAVPETEDKSASLPITISSIPDGVSKWSSDVYKKGDVVYSISGVRDYGYKECEYSNNDITDVEYLYRASVAYLSKLVNPYLTIDVKAVDLSLLYMDKYSPMEVGQAVRVRSEPHGVDEYLRISEISIDLLDPSNDSYTLGESYDSLTGQQSSYMKKLNSSINASFDIVGSAADAASKLADAANKKAQDATVKADTATETANSASSKADEAKTKADTATDTANNASAKADEAKTDAANASSKADEANTKADTATETANSASQNAQKANEAAKKAQEDATTAIGNAKDAADKAAAASKRADDNTAKIETVETTIKTISGDTATAIANAKKAQDAADAANKAAEQAKADASTANTEIGKVQSQVGTINTEISNIKQEATDLRDDLSGQITTVKNTMEADYTRKTELSETTNTLRNEIIKSAAGVIHTVSQDYATKKELKTTTDATNKNATDLTNAINKFNSDVDNLQGQIDGAIETWFYEVDPTDENEPTVNWTTDTLKKVHLGDLYYNTVSGYCWRYQLQNGSYSWSRITDVDVTKALKDAAAAQTTANSKKRVFVTTPTPPYDVGDLWTQGSTGDIMRCQTAKTSSQSYAAADWVKASKYTDDTAVTKLSNTVEKTYSTKTEVKQLSDRIEQTVSSVESVKVSAEAAQSAADNAKKAADAAQSAADTAKANAATAQSKADEAAKNLATAEENLKTLQSQANATDEQLTAAKAEVEKAKTAAATAQGTADTAKANAATAQATADTAKANAKTAQDDVDALKNRVTSAETSIEQNSAAIALRATKTEVTSAIDGISVGGRNLLRGSNVVAAESTTYIEDKYGWYSNGNPSSIKAIEDNGETVIEVKRSGTPTDGLLPSVVTQWVLLEWGEEYRASIDIKVNNDFHGSHVTPFHFHIKASDSSDPFASGSLAEIATATITLSPSDAYLKANTWYHFTYTIKTPAKTPDSTKPYCKFRLFVYGKNNGSIVAYNTSWLKKCKLEKGNKPTDWSPAPEDLQNDATTKANNALASAKTYADAQIKVSANGIKSEVSSVKTTADSALSKATSVEQTANGLTTKVTTAQSTADTAKANAKTAQDTANAAKSTAADAKSTANTASSNASSALTKANAAASDAATAKSDASTAKSNAATAQSTANTANSTANAAKTATNTLETLIRQSGDGVEVAKKVNGEYTSTKTLMSDDGVHIQDQSNNDLASFTTNKIQLGKNSRDSIIELCDDNGRIKSSKTGYIQLESDGLTSLQSARDNGIYNGMATVFAQAMPTNQDCYSYIGLEVTSKKSGSGDPPGAQISLESTKTDGSQVSSINLMADSMYFSNSHSSYGQISMENVRNSMLVAHGTSGNWYYRKWVSGYGECWGFFPYSFTEFRWWTSQSYVKYTYPAFNSVSYPFTFKEEPALYAEYKASVAQSGIAILGYNNSGTTSTGEINVMIPDYGASGSGEGIMYIHAFGEYKW